MRQHYSLHVGINDYPNAPLQGCVNDAHDWEGLCRNLGYQTNTLIDEAAYKRNILSVLEQIVSRARFGDRIVFTYSGHGSWIPDSNGDEADGRDEVLCAIDYEDGGYITDDEIQAIVQSRRFGVRFTIFSDSCHSGTVNRFVDSGVLRAAVPGVDREVRFVPPATFLQGHLRDLAYEVSHKAITTPRLKSGSVLFSGCTDEEYSYDAFIRGKYNGAFTATALAAYQELVANGSPVTYKGWHSAIRYLLPTNAYPQSPQLFATAWQRTWRL